MGQPKPRLLDLFCGPGGAAKGYQDAGFYVTGVDIVPQPRYAGDEFLQADALTWSDFDGFDAVHAAPMWQAFSPMSSSRGREGFGDQVTLALGVVRSSGLPWICETGRFGNHRGTYLFCGASFGLRVIRHYYFSASFPLMVPPCTHKHGGVRDGLYIGYPAGGQGRGGCRTDSAMRDAMEMPWARAREGRWASPPRYTELIGAQLLDHLRAREAA